LAWIKPNGQRLDMLWGYEQGFHAQDGWTAPGGPGDATGLIRVGLTPTR
jgi:hypothetical protein